MEKFNTINTINAPQAIGPYSQAVVVGNLNFYFWTDSVVAKW